MRKWFTKRLSGGALQFVVFIGVVIALLLTAFISLTHMHLFFKKQTDKQIETIRNLNLGWSFFLSDIEQTGDSIIYKIPEDEKAILGISRDFYGLFEKVTVTSVRDKARFSQMGFTGSYPSERTALYLQDLNRPLVFVGQARIEGKAFLPEAGVRPGNISGNSFYGNQLIHGKEELSTTSLPPLSKKAELSLRELIDTNYKEDFEPISSLEREMVRSFKTQTALFYSQSSLTLQRIKASGNLIIKSSGTLTVRASAILEDVILVAPRIKINKGVSGNFQAIATEKINVEGDVDLQYPSALILINNVANEWQNPEHGINPNQIYLAKNSSVKGMLVYLEEGKRPKGRSDFEARILMQENSVCNGEVYCEGNMELKGTVKGSVFTSRFVAQEFGSVYQNHVYNGRILAEDLAEEFGGLPLSNTPKTVMKWLY